jgi:LysM repeat protein
VIDAYSGLYQTYSLDTFLDSWSVLGNMAVIYAGEALPVPAQERLEGETYIVQPGDYLNGLALQFGLSWQDLADWNRLDPPYTIFAGQQLIVAPVENVEPTEPETPEVPVVEPPASKPDVYTITPGDTLLNIAARFDTTWQQLAATNGLRYPYFIYPQQEMQLPPAAPVTAEAEPVDQPVEPVPVEPAAPETYTVQHGDGLMAVAEQLGLDWQELAALNGIDYPYTLYPGRILLLR